MKRRRSRLWTREGREAYAMLLPFLAFFALFVAYPVLRSVLDSFTNYNMAQRVYIGAENYLRLLRDRTFLRAVGNTLQYAACSILPLMALGLGAALLVNRQTKLMFAARAAFMYPYVTSMVAVSMVWLYLYEPTSGILNKLLAAAGIAKQRFLFDEAQALWCLIVMNVWKNLGYVMILYLAGLQSVPRDLYEAAAIDGAGSFLMLRRITLPCLRPVSYFLLTTLCVECFKTFEQVRLMTNGGPVNATTTITHQIYIRAFGEFKMGYASAMSVVLLGIVFIFTVANLRLGRQLDT